MRRLLLVTLLFSTVALAQERQTANTLKLAEGAKAGAATIDDIAWLAGHWRGEGLGGVAEEIWTAPENGVMLGMYRLMREGKPLFYELMTLSEKEGTIALRLKHFNPDMTGWEEKDDYVEFPFIAKRGEALHFGGLTIVPDGAKMTMYLAIRGKDGVREETFRYTRVKASDD